jgi:guanyl-specific ribonuclease Sa
MTTLHRHARLTAWLGLIAMWLVVCAPLVSQLVVAARAQEPVAALCSATTPSAVSTASSAHYDAAPGSLAACGYCDLLATHSAMPSLPPVAVQVLTLVVILVLAVLSVRFTPLGAFPSGRPRAPPFAS